MIKIAVTGASGRMGSTILGLLNNMPDASIGGAIERSGSDAIGTQVFGTVISENLRNVIQTADAIIDFTSPEASAAHAAIAAELSTPIVIGTTGMSDAQMSAVRAAGEGTAVVYSPNTSIGVNLFWHVAAQLAAITKDRYALHIEETHHVHKVDAPSGTAKRLHSMVAAASGQAHDNIPMVSHREGEVIGDHSVQFDNADDTITIQHHAKDRRIFAQGAITAAQWAAKQPAGFYSMNDVLGIS